MKILKYVSRFLLALIAILVIAVVLILALDTHRTGYLSVKNLQSAENSSWLITHANVIPMNHDTVLTDKMVYILNGRIEAIGDELPVEQVEIIDAKGSFLMPGLTDMHVHLWDKYELGLYLSHGVTAIRNVWGMPVHLRMKKQINNGEIIAPSFFTTGPKLTGPEFIGDDNLQLFSPEAGRDKVIEYKKRGYDFIKTYYGLTPDIFDAILKQARESGMEVVAHPSQKIPWSYLFNPPIVSIEHAEDIVQQPLQYQLDTLELNEVVREFAAHPQTSFCPTLMAYYNIVNMLADDELLESEQVKWMNASIRLLDSKPQFERWQSAKRSDTGVIQRTRLQHAFHLMAIKKLHEAGVNIICGTDAGIGVTVPGQSIHDELAFYSAAGLSNYEVLKTATVNITQVHAPMQNLGTVEVGKMANLLLLQNNPLTDLTALQNPAAVFVNGRMIDRHELERFRQKAYNRHNLVATAIRYIENLWVEK